MEITNGDVRAEVPDVLAKLLIENRGWEKSRRRSRATAASHEEAIPMTHIPGVVPGISMNRLKKLVADGTIPFVQQDRTKLVKPSDVRRVIDQEAKNG